MRYEFQRTKTHESEFQKARTYIRWNGCYEEKTLFSFVINFRRFFWNAFSFMLENTNKIGIRV